MSFKGLGLENIIEIGNLVKKNCFSIGVSFGGCTLPGVGVVHSLLQ
jgi:hypothetical protein